MIWTDAIDRPTGTRRPTRGEALAVASWNRCIQVTNRSTLLAALVSLAWMIGCLGVARAEEPAEAFLQALKSRGYYPLALEYLQRLETNPSIPAEFRERLDYERGEVYIPAALAERQTSKKQELLNQAEAAFDRFIKNQPNHVAVVLARGRLASLQIEQARLRIAQANRDTTMNGARQGLLDQARELLKQATKTYNDQQTQVREQLEKIPKSLDAKKDAALIRTRDDLRAEYVQASFAAAMAIYEEAQTYAAESDDRAKKLKEAEQAFGQVAEKYRTRASGVYALLFQGRCHQELNDPRRALSFYEDLLTLPGNEPTLRPIITKALIGAMECYLLPDIAQLESARQKAEVWLEGQRPDERGEDDWLTAKWLLARTYQELAKAAEAGKKRTEYQQEARRLAIEVAKVSGPFQADAQALLAQAGAQSATPAGPKLENIATFADALAAAEEGLAQRQVLARTIETLKERLAQLAPGPDQSDVQKQIDEGQAQIKELEQQIADFLNRSEQLTNEDTTVDQLNLVRFYRSALHYYQGDYIKSAVLAEFLATRYPGSSAGQRAAPMALASMIQLLGDGRSAWAQSLRERIERTAQIIVARGAQNPEAADALNTLVTLALQQGDAGKAEGYLSQLPEESAKRGLAELAVGQALWNQSTSQPKASTSPERQRAVSLLQQGLKRLPADEASPATIAATLLVAQDALQKSDAKLAVQLLEDPKRGPKTLADAGHAHASAAELRQKIYATAISAYIGALPELDDPAPMINKALAVLDQLNHTSSANGDAQRMASTYVALAKNLQQQITEAPVERRSTLVHAFDQFLDRAAGTTKDRGVLTWIAESYVNLGEAIGSTTDKDAAGKEAASQLYAKGLKIYEDILRRANAKELTLTPQEQLLVRTRLAIVYRTMGRYADAMESFADILTEQENQVYIQMEAARTLQAWGQAGEASAFERAIMGERPDPKTNRHRIWGYGRVARLAASNASLKDLFHEARLHLAECRLAQAQRAGEAEKGEMLQRAEQDIRMTAKLYPDLGGTESRAAYDRLLKEIQQAQGKPPKGL